MGISDRLQTLRQWRPDFSSARPPLEKYYGYFLAALVGWALADLTLMWYRPMMLPSQRPPTGQARPHLTKTTQVGDYNVIADRDLFNEDGKIPPALAAGPSEDSNEQNPVLSQLPLGLTGTIVHFNPKLSIATIEVRNKNVTLSYRPDEEIEGMARVVRVERKRVVFMNLNNRRLEYIEIPDDVAFNFDVKAPKAEEATNDIIQKKGEFDFSIKRTDLEGLTSNLSSLLQQARMEPRIGADGQVDGFCFVNIQPASIYEKLGMKTGDCIKSVNGEAVNSPGKAMELYQLLKQASFVQLGMERGGRDEKFNYSIQ
jgi:general secretion pathway protein C